ncbi:MAG TPA: 3-oxosteroid 1-dehydrogenase [Gordonia sp. (in: high G+C Gram-positive bacteria)]|uniref:3-oxosteroid 1-dehydrogenase n=1 Tax=unclassified Gordonia (in: high G+C Gram-positive bacteria) TaxID=2657482 RepID=UPI0025C2A827|nr:MULTISPECIES: 3-oxosteroid 1-dehydrogenase [unclassified Gordonia (in: high G+C Gram-positive bacteria)]HNP56782.1 3-oxosteroid 1-dehydrogenase [Gordonia sp. (in: high G+C Gram-positive bacteria)]HRC49905.1 3-oxosteroid 1-dehydrogenase [Gordonia sp. (in: high G+C Gram-positive bacteria)]
MTTPPETFDVIVVGAGAAGMSAALTAATQGLSTVLIEKSPYWGGSTSRSGGGVWIPNNSVLRRDGVEDTVDEARKYVHSIIGEHAPAAKIDAYIDRGPEALDYLIAHSALELEWVKDYSDYYPEAPGGRLGGRSVEPKPFDARRLGADLDNLHPQYTKAPLNMVVLQSDYRWMNIGTRHRKGIAKLVKVASRFSWSKFRNKKLIAMGAALSSELLLGLREAGVPIRFNTALTDLITDENGAVVGVVTESDGERAELGARYGVILGTGGFEHNDAMRKQYQRAPIGTEWTTGAPSNTGDGITAGIKAGADVALMDDAWWGPTIPLPKGPWFALSERSVPGTFIVNERGERFMNESLPYVEAAHHMYGGDFGQGDGPGENVPAWMIMDTRCRGRYLFAGLTAKQPIPKSWLASGVIVKADTIAELAEKIGVPAENLVATTEKFNGFARDGVDKDFGRGASGYDHYYGDITNKPNPSLGPVDKGPFYAVKMVPGDLGTKGGIVTDEDGRALRPDGSVINGLYAAGNTSAPVMGHTYAGPGATIGPAMVFGYLAALDAKAKADAAASSTAASGA